jgi:hypothetical protein
LEESKGQIEDMLSGYVNRSEEKAITASHATRDTMFKAYLDRALATTISAPE